MGNTPTVASPRLDGKQRQLELRLSRPHVEQIAGAPHLLFAGLRSSAVDRGTAVTNAPWDEATVVTLSSDSDSIIISLFTADSSEAYRRGERQLVSEAELPYLGANGLQGLGIAPDKPPVDFRVAFTRGIWDLSPRSQRSLPDGVTVAIRARELGVAAASGIPHSGPLASTSLAASLNSLGSTESGPSSSARQLLKLELENAALRARLRVPEDQTKPNHVRHLQMVQQDNANLTAQIAAIERNVEKIKASRLDGRYVPDGTAGGRQGFTISGHQFTFDDGSVHTITKKTEAFVQVDGVRGGYEYVDGLLVGGSSGSAWKKQATRPSTNTKDWGRTLHVMSKELELCQKRQQEIRRNYEDRAKGLQSMLQQARIQIDRAQVLKSSSNGSGQGVSPQVAEVRAEIDQARKLRNELQRQLIQIREASAQVEAKTESREIHQLRIAIAQCGEDLEQLKKEVSIKHSQKFGSVRCQELSSHVKRLQEEIEENQQQCTDMRVRAESEVQELKTQCDGVKDRLDASVTELRFLRERAKALREANNSSGDMNNVSAGDIERLRAEVMQQQKEYDDLKAIEQARMTTVQDLEKELEQLEEKARRAFHSCQGHASTADAISDTGKLALARQLEEEKRLLLQQEEGLKSLQEQVGADAS